MRSAGAHILTVTTPAGSYDLADLPTVKDDLNITDDASDGFLGRAISRASAAVANFCNRPFVVETLDEKFWPARDGWPHSVTAEVEPLQLARWPAVAITSVVETIAGIPTTLVAGTDYLLDAEKGQISRLDRVGYPRRWRPQLIEVVYSAGFNPIPDDIVDAVTRLVKLAWISRTRDPTLRSETIPGVYSAGYTTASGSMPDDVVGLLDGNYRVPVMA